MAGEEKERPDEGDLMWLDNDAPEYANSPGGGSGRRGTDAGDGAPSGAALVQQLEDELGRAKKELAEVRKELAAKIVQLSRKDQDKASAQNSVAQEKAAEIAASAAADKDYQVTHLATRINQLELALAQREEELDEARRLVVSQKKALREVMSSAAERGAEERAAVEASTSAQAQALEEELEHVQQELMATRTRAQLEVRAREAEVAALRRELDSASRHRAAAIAEAEAALTEAWEHEVARVQEAAQARIEDLEAEVLRLRHTVEDVQRQAANTSLPMELVALNSKKVQVQKEFEVFKEMANQTTRTSREEIARLLEENARLMARLASKTIEAASVPSANPQQPLHARGPHAHESGGRKVFESLKYDSYEDYIPTILMKLERQRKGLAPLVVVSCLAALIVIIAVVRAGASARSQHRGPLCFLAKLGISIGPGCGNAAKDEYQKGMAELLEVTPRVHDIEPDIDSDTTISKATAEVTKPLAETHAGGPDSRAEVSAAEEAAGGDPFVGEEEPKNSTFVAEGSSAGTSDEVGEGAVAGVVAGAGAAQAAQNTSSTISSTNGGADSGIGDAAAVVPEEAAGVAGAAAAVVVADAVAGNVTASGNVSVLAAAGNDTADSLAVAATQRLLQLEDAPRRRLQGCARRFLQRWGLASA